MNYHYDNLFRDFLSLQNLKVYDLPKNGRLKNATTDFTTAFQRSAVKNKRASNFLPPKSDVKQPQDVSCAFGSERREPAPAAAAVPWCGARIGARPPAPRGGMHLQTRQLG